ncbi:MAG: hypothetical protein M0C28_18650 [Candidatus Moduliflexus flocculans]|nr:hypothetical protein [Candidatus Moduliflexus flocculans]
MKDLARYADTVSICLSKGLRRAGRDGARRAARALRKGQGPGRKLMGGGMRQAACFLAAAGILALTKMLGAAAARPRERGKRILEKLLARDPRRHGRPPRARHQHGLLGHRRRPQARPARPTPSARTPASRSSSGRGRSASSPTST